eukprot:gene36717-44540_t
MFARTARAIPAAKNLFANASVRQKSGFASTLYDNVWKKSNVMYITYVVAGCVALEVVYGGVTNYIWESYNYGKLYHQIDWSKFKSADEDDE